MLNGFSDDIWFKSCTALAFAQRSFADLFDLPFDYVHPTPRFARFQWSRRLATHFKNTLILIGFSHRHSLDQSFNCSTLPKAQDIAQELVSIINSNFGSLCVLFLSNRSQSKSENFQCNQLWVGHSIGIWLTDHDRFLARWIEQFAKNATVWSIINHPSAHNESLAGSNSLSLMAVIHRPMGEWRCYCNFIE